jgi:hypothetical protein
MVSFVYCYHHESYVQKTSFPWKQFAYDLMQSKGGHLKILNFLQTFKFKNFCKFSNIFFKKNSKYY